MKAQKTIYWIATGLISLIFLFSAGMYIFNHSMAAGFYEALGFPTWLIYPSAIAKILAVVAILTRKSAFLKEWAYAGLFFDAVLATAAHAFHGDGIGLSVVALLLLAVSRFLDGKVFNRE